MEWFPREWTPILIVDRESVDQLNLLMGEGWGIGKGDGRLPLLLFPKKLSETTGLPARWRVMLEGDGMDEMLVAILARLGEGYEQHAVLTMLPGPVMDYSYVTDVIRRSHREWRVVVMMSLGSRGVVTILERGESRG